MLVCDVFIVDDVGNTMMFHVKKSTEMGKIKEMYSERYMIPVTSIDFFFDGRKIHDDDTPKGLELEEGDAIEVHKVGGGQAPKMPGGSNAYVDDLNSEMRSLLLEENDVIEGNRKEDMDKVELRVVGKNCNNNCY